MARASPRAMPRRSPRASATAPRLASTSAPRASATTASGWPASPGAPRSTRSAARRGNQRERIRRDGMGNSGSDVLVMFAPPPAGVEFMGTPPERLGPLSPG